MPVMICRGVFLVLREGASTGFLADSGGLHSGGEIGFAIDLRCKRCQEFGTLVEVV